MCDSGNAASLKKRENVTQWEGRSNGCYKFQCHNEMGPIYWKQCNKTDEVCENYQCVRKEEVLYTVTIEVEGMDVSSFSLIEIRSLLSDLTNIEKDKFRIRIDASDKGEIRNIIVVTSDKTTAEDIGNKVSAAISEHKQEGIVRFFKNVRVKVNELSISCGTMNKEKNVIFAMVLIIVSLHSLLR